MLRTQDLFEATNAKISTLRLARNSHLISPYICNAVTSHTTVKMPGISLANTIAELNLEDEWGPEVTTSTTLEGVPYAPFSKGDKLGRMADWTQEGKEGRDRGQRYGRGYRGEWSHDFVCDLVANNHL